MEITLNVEAQYQTKVDLALIEWAALKTAQTFGADKTQTTLSITITNNQTITQLNHQYRGIDAPTDVLSFANRPDPDFPTIDPALNNHLGDIIIAYPVAVAQAEAGAHSAQDEMLLLTVHGTLHLLGFDHDTPRRKQEMWAAQQQLMSALGLPHVVPTET